MAAGLPVVATDVGGNREVVLPEETGLLVPAGDAAALAEAMVAILTDPPRARRLGAGGLARVSRDFSIARTVAAYEEIYDTLTSPVRGAVAVAA
jgi:glycosyltransferase involved in cell wall biosynthesis